MFKSLTSSNSKHRWWLAPLGRRAWALHSICIQVPIARSIEPMGHPSCAAERDSKDGQQENRWLAVWANISGLGSAFASIFSSQIRTGISEKHPEANALQRPSQTSPTATNAASTCWTLLQTAVTQLQAPLLNISTTSKRPAGADSWGVRMILSLTALPASLRLYAPSVVTDTTVAGKL